MNMKTFFTILLAASLITSFNAISAESKDTQKAILSYALPANLDWKDSNKDGFENDRQHYTLEGDDSITLLALQAGNQNIWDQFKGKDTEAAFKELSKGKKAAQKLAGYTNWTADKSMEKKSDNEIIFEMSGSYMDGKEKQFFVEKYYITPYGFVMVSLDWDGKSNEDFVKKAKNDLKNIAFKTEIK